MPNWPDQDETLINQFVRQLNLNCYSAPYRSLLRKFQRFVAQRFPKRAFSEARSQELSAQMRQLNEKKLPAPHSWTIPLRLQ